MEQAAGVCLCRKPGAGEHGKWKDVQMIGIETKGKVYAGKETLQGIRREPVDEVEAEYRPGFVE